MIKIQYKAGKITEEILRAASVKTPTRGPRTKATSAKKRKANFKFSVREFARVLNSNFGPEDAVLTLSYELQSLLLKVQPETDSAALILQLLEAAVKDFALYRKALDRACQKAGTELRFVRLTSDFDAATGEALQFHHILIVPADCRDIALTVWGDRGPATAEAMPGLLDLTPLAEQLASKVRQGTPLKTYSPSHNLTHPLPEETECSDDTELTPPPGALVFEVQGPSSEGLAYIRYTVFEGGGTNLTPPENMHLSNFRDKPSCLPDQPAA